MVGGYRGAARLWRLDPSTLEPSTLEPSTLEPSTWERRTLDPDGTAARAGRGASGLD